MRIERDGGGAVRVTFSGPLDRETVPGVRRGLLAAARRAGAGGLTLDLSGVPRFDTAGVALLVETLRAARRRNAPLCLTGAGEQPRHMLRLARLETVFGTC